MASISDKLKRLATSPLNRSSKRQALSESSETLVGTQRDIFNETLNSSTVNNSENKMAARGMANDRSFLEEELCEQFSNIIDEQIEGLTRGKSSKDRDNLKNMNTLLKAVIPIFSKMCNVAIEAGAIKAQTSINDVDQKANLILFKTDKIDQDRKEKNLRLIQVPESEGDDDTEDMKQIVSAVASKASVEVKTDDIDVVYRVGKKQPNAQKPRVIHVEFKSRVVREKLYAKKKEVKKQNIFLVEDLTPARSLMLSKLREKKTVVDTAFTRDGKILIYRTGHRKGSKPETVESLDDLHKYGLDEDDFNEVIDKMKLT